MLIPDSKQLEYNTVIAFPQRDIHIDDSLKLLKNDA
ncbi:MAG: hypothetical protein ACI8Q3_000658 [Marinomonas primoryensis]|jgi:hypothetical protein